MKHNEARAMDFAKRFADRLNKAQDKEKPAVPKGPPPTGELGHAVRSKEFLIGARKRLAKLRPK